ncbi:type II toxin-antitoxin system PemK/MazF family toxin [Jidongwangia harbinensis]|uniref:type II toxin-antitoxin system PemK/MazF family toxin n=1 Tax=Jidongwangia harbinensis TaxID=2878561 RepID=UPI001CD95264|nr:type II toxin-antitoxin system PemK/MazF family toxin [Jidongwangia harbinensis]MCA2218664.1 type II toxin-antitoxin system PemK/MazF family toxin [Jidongwangia harbinensis]
MIRRGDIYWAGLGSPRPVLVVQAQPYNDSRLPTVLAAVVTSNTKAAALPGNVFLPAAMSGLPHDAVVNVAALITVDKAVLDGPVGSVPFDEMSAVDDGLRKVLGVGAR